MNSNFSTVHACANVKKQLELFLAIDRSTLVHRTGSFLLDILNIGANPMPQLRPRVTCFSQKSRLSRFSLCNDFPLVQQQVCSSNYGAFRGASHYVVLV
jgi:hypothetical protein